MGKYMRKAKGAGEVAVMEVSSQSSFGVRTRARTRTLLALQKDQKKASSAPHKPPTVCIEAAPTTTTSSYLELRSRKLEKATTPQETQLYCTSDADTRRSSLREHHSYSHSAFIVSEEQQQQPKPKKQAKLSITTKQRSSSREVPSAVGYSRSNSTSFSQVCSKVKAGRAQGKETVKKRKAIGAQTSRRAQEAQLQDSEDEAPTPMEASFGENAIEQDRHIREATPSNLIGDGGIPEEAPGSTTRPTCRSSARRRLRDESRRNAPTSHEMEEFFAGAERQQQTRFIERYNYDPVNDLPLPGRYEWVRMRT